MRRAQKKRYGGTATLGALALLAIYGATSFTETPTEAADAFVAFAGAVMRVVDGDTLWIDGQSGRIRIWGLDAPETDAPDGATARARSRRGPGDPPPV